VIELTNTIIQTLIIGLLILLTLADIPCVYSQSNKELPVDLQMWITEQDGYSADLTQVYSHLEKALSGTFPRGIVPTPLLDAGKDPGSFTNILQNVMENLSELETNTNILASLINQYENLYSLDSACQYPTLTPPESLDEAVSQISEITQNVTMLTMEIFTEKETTFLRNNLDLVIRSIYSAPYGAGINIQNIDTIKKYISIMDSRNITDLFCAAQQIAALLDSKWQSNLRGLLASHPRAKEKIIKRQQTPLGEIVFGGEADNNLLSGNVLFVADLAGDDIYALQTKDLWSGIPQIILDFEGNDIYESLETGGYASGIGSIGILEDHDGDDTYHAASLTQGFGLFGIGMLYDHQGNDEYFAWGMAQGSSLFGIGAIIDNKGTDRYQSAGLAQGVGMTNGLGILTDRSGDDVYLSTGLSPTNYGTPGLSDSWSQGVGVGFRTISPGGIGILRDSQGSDHFTAGSFAQGGGYFYGLGLFSNYGHQDDRYLGSRYNFGWGAHVGVGYFLEQGGDDEYKTRQIVSSGLAWDLSLVLFEDRSGNDTYKAGDFSLGASAHHSIAIFHDYSGNDNYLNIYPAKSSQGQPNLSIFIDSGGDSDYFEFSKKVEPCQIKDKSSFILIHADTESLNQLKCKNK